MVFDVAVLNPRRGLALTLVATAQFVLVLDITIVTIALPTIQRQLGFKQAELQWLVTSYALAFESFLLLGGRAADLFGRRRMFIGGSCFLAPRRLPPGSQSTRSCLSSRAPAKVLPGPWFLPPRCRF